MKWKPQENKTSMKTSRDRKKNNFLMEMNQTKTQPFKNLNKLLLINITGIIDDNNENYILAINKKMIPG